MMTSVRRDAVAQEAQVRWTFCVRSAATYQCLSYGSDGEVRRKRHDVRAHGTAFAFRREGAQTLLMTNQHVADWPFVSGDDDVEGVGPGCRRVSASVHIVDNEEDTYAKDDIALTRVLSDAELDIAILRAPFRVAAIPFDIGHSGGLRTGAAVHVRGYPLGAFQAVTLGKIINPRQPDSEQGWDHVDFVVDAPLSEGSSGSPVLAANCTTGRFELIGVFHAAYKTGQSLNVVVGVDQLSDIMRTLRPRPAKTSELVPTLADRVTLVQTLSAGGEGMIPFGSVWVRVERLGDRLRFIVFGKGFPLASAPIASIIDEPTEGGGRFAGIAPLGAPRVQNGASLRVSDQRAMHRLWRLLRLRARDVGRHRQLTRHAARSRAAHQARERLETKMEGRVADERAALNHLAGLVGRLNHRKPPRSPAKPRHK